MLEIQPFRGYRFVCRSPSDLGRFIAPPYDMIDRAMVDELYKKDPYNAVRITQNRPEPADTANRDRHRRAAGIFRTWLQDGVIAADPETSLYIYNQRFSVAIAGRGRSFERTGIIALVKLVDFSENVVLPHEYTLSGPKADRYELMEETRLNTGQIFGLVSDDTRAVYAAISGMKGGPLLGSAVDGNGVVHELSRCTDPEVISRFGALVSGCSVLIADGHHRYETALNFFNKHGRDPALSFVMMTLVSMADPGLIIRSFHRLIRSSAAHGLIDMKIELGRYFAMVDRGPATPEALNAFLGGANDGTMLWCDSVERRLYSLSLNGAGESFLKTVIPERSLQWKKLDVSKINVIAINGILGLPLDGTTLHDAIDYMNDAQAALQKCLAGGDYYGCFFIHPLSIRAIHEVVAGGERMPQKSTNFYPKLYSGLVFNRLGDA